MLVVKTLMMIIDDEDDDGNTSASANATVTKNDYLLVAQTKSEMTPD
jgi:hypothetical protein